MAVPTELAGLTSNLQAIIQGAVGVGVVAVAALGYAKTQFKPSAANPTEAVVVAGAFGGPKQQEHILDELKRIASFMEKSYNANADNGDRLDRLERAMRAVESGTRGVESAVRHLSEVNQGNSDRTAEALLGTTAEYRRSQEASDKLYRQLIIMISTVKPV